MCLLNGRPFDSKFQQSSIWVLVVTILWNVSFTDHDRHPVSTWRRRHRSYVQYVVYDCVHAETLKRWVRVVWVGGGAPGWIHLHNAAHVHAPVVICCPTLIHIHWFIWIHIEITGKQMISGVDKHDGN